MTDLRLTQCLLSYYLFLKMCRTFDKQKIMRLHRNRVSYTFMKRATSQSNFLKQAYLQKIDVSRVGYRSSLLYKVLFILFKFLIMPAALAYPAIQDFLLHHALQQEKHEDAIHSFTVRNDILYNYDAYLNSNFTFIKTTVDYCYKAQKISP